MKEVNLQVKDETAKKIEQLSKEKKEQLSRLIDLWVSKPRPILQVMEELGEYATRQGLTKEKLDDLLKDE
ncbi:MAG TPA: hypothetical protein VIH57_01450 [Bacteroidales bacterium]